MRAYQLLSLAALLGLSPAVFAQIPGVYERPIPPDTAALSRLNLKTEWSIGLPLLGRQDAVKMVQILDGDQFVLQTRSGLVAMMDARTGSKQWAFQLPAAFANTWPIGFDDRYIFVLNVTILYCFNRQNGFKEFELELPYPPTMGPMADRDFVYVVTNGNRISSYRMPESARPGNRGASESLNLVTQIAGRVGGSRSPMPPPPQEPSQYTRPPTGGTYASPNQKTPSITSLPSVTPPYSLAKRTMLQTPSVSVVPSLRQPYTLRPEHLQYNQITPSVAVIPPSIYRVHQLANFRAKPIQPQLVWSHLLPERVGAVPFRVVAYPPGPNNPPPAKWFPDRIWIATERQTVMSISSQDGGEQVSAELRDTITTPFGGPLVFDRSGTGKFEREEDLTALGYVGLLDGTFQAIDLGAGGREAETAGRARTEWRTNLGAPATNKPLVTADAVYASGEHAGVIKLNAQTGDELWETEAVADRILAVNDDYAYVKDRAGNLRIYDNKLQAGGQGAVPPLATIAVPGFNVPVQNDQTDRIFLVSDSGMMICLRDASGKYNRPLKVTPPNPLKYAPKPPAPMQPAFEP